IMQAAASPEAPSDLAEPLIAYLNERWGPGALERDAATHRTARSKWRRIAALRILSRIEHPRHLELLGEAAVEPDREVAAVAFSLLGASSQPAAADMLIAALRRKRHPASRIAVQLDRSPVPLANRL